jgi:hypothetical protein
MAIIKKGILGPLEGSLANVTGYLRLNKPVLRMKPERGAKAKKPRSLKQLASNARMALVMKFIKPNTPFLNVGFSLNRPDGWTAHNMAVSQLLHFGIHGEYPALELNYQNILVSDGDLPMAINTMVEMTEESTIRFSWDVTAKSSYQRSRDQVMLLAFMPEEQTAFYLNSGARRNAGQELLEVCSGISGQVFETYIAFISDDRKKISKSIYAGQIVVA